LFLELVNVPALLVAERPNHELLSWAYRRTATEIGQRITAIGKLAR
jgi:hypothetical protein